MDAELEKRLKDVAVGNNRDPVQVQMLFAFVLLKILKLLEKE